MLAVGTVGKTSSAQGETQKRLRNLQEPKLSIVLKPMKAYLTILER